jgi:hypothetical protein
MRRSLCDQYRASYLEALPEAAEGDEIAMRTVRGIEELARGAEENRRKNHPFLPEKAGDGCLASLDWIQMVDSLSEEQLNAMREEHERSLRPKPAQYGALRVPTLDDFDKLGVTWGNA